MTKWCEEHKLAYDSERWGHIDRCPVCWHDDTKGLGTLQPKLEDMLCKLVEQDNQYEVHSNIHVDKQVKNIKEYVIGIIKTYRDGCVVLPSIYAGYTISDHLESLIKRIGDM